ncbi:MAG TPA: hypothetical protein VGD41_16125, partial [Pyrinomonadaceae bacterium]
LLYLRRTHFIKRSEAIERWKGNALDALVAPTDESTTLLQELPRSALAGLADAAAVNGQRRGYVLLMRR